MTYPKIAIIHPRLMGYGGSEIKAMWTAQALKRDFRISIITMGDVNLPSLNNYCGTSIAEEEVNIISLPIPSFMNRYFAAVRSYRLFRLCKSISKDYDVMISAYNVMDFGKPGIQFIADFSFDDELRSKYDAGVGILHNLIYKSSPLRKIYLNIAEKVRGENENAWKRNVTIANSQWTKNVFADKYNIHPIVIYPPVPGRYPFVPWKKRENGFVYVGRISPEKNIDEMIEIIRRLNEKGEKLHFHIYGELKKSKYVSNIEKLCKINKDWAFLEGVILGEQKYKELSKHKYAISGRRAEPFGISVAEMVKAGCLVWVPDGGGQVEIIEDARLTYKSIEDAVTKIQSVLRSAVLQEVLRERLKKRHLLYSTDRFIKEIRDVIFKFIRKDRVSVSINT